MLVTQLEDAVKALDQPTMDGLNTYFVSRAAHQAGLKVALSGLGSDEIFGGYSTFASTPRAAFVAGLGRWIPGPFRRLTAGAAVRIASGDAVRKAAAAGAPPRISRMRIISRASCSRLLACGACLRRISNPTSIRAVMTIPWRERMRETARQAERLDSFTSVSCFELQSYMVNTLLRDTDAASMANSLEVRVPFLDHRLVEFVGRLPKSAKYMRGRSEILAGRSALRCAAGRSGWPVQANIHSAVGSLAAGSARRASVAGSGESHAAVAAIYESARGARRVAELRDRPDQLVASLEPVRAQ